MKRGVPAALLMVGSSLLFATMGVFVKYASARYSAGEIVMYRGLVGALGIGLLARTRGVTLATRVPGMHAWRSIVGVTALSLWFYSIGRLPLATAVTLNYMSSVWMALFLVGGAVLMGAERVDPRLLAAVLAGFAGVALVLHPSLGQDQLAPGLVGLASGMLSALAYLQVATLGRAGEPELRVVFYFSIGSCLAGVVIATFQGWHPITLPGLGMLFSAGLLATVAQLLMTRAYAVGRALTNASLAYLGIAFSFAYGVWLFDDPVTLPQLSGIALIVGAGLVASRLRARTLGREAADTLPPPSDP